MIDAITAPLLADAAGALLIATSILVLFGGAEVASRIFDLPTEWTRKSTHLGSGVIVFAFPWLVSSAITVAVLAVAFAGVLIGGRVTGLLGSIHNVERRTGGAYYYPFAVLGVWLLSGGEPLLFCVPLAIMAVADTGAALVGKHRGQTTYQVMDGTRTLEGSMAFFGLAFAIVLLGTAIAGRPGWPATLLVALVVAALTTSVEAVSVRGSDNVGIPYSAWLAMEHTERLGLDALGDWVLGMIFGLVLLLVTASRGRLDPAAGTLVFLVATLSFALGGWAWFLPLLAAWSLFLVARTPDGVGLDRMFPTTAASMGLLLAYAHTGDDRLQPAFLASVASSAAMTGVLVGMLRKWPRTLLALAGAGVPVIVAKAFFPWSWVYLPFGAALISAVLLHLLVDAPQKGRRVLISGAAGLAVWFALWWGGTPG